MATLPAPAAACNAAGKVESTHSSDLAAIPFPDVIDLMVAGEAMEEEVTAEAAERLRDFVRTLADWEDFPDAVEAMAAVDTLERAANKPPALTAASASRERHQDAAPVDAEATARLWRGPGRPLAGDDSTGAERIARMLVLGQSDLGRDAAAVSGLARSLHQAMIDFAERHPQDAAEAALRDAGLHDGSWSRATTEESSWRPDTFDEFHAAVRGFAFTVDRIAEALTDPLAFARSDCRTATIVRKPLG